MKEFLGNSLLFGANAPFVEGLYEAYLEDPTSVSAEWRGYFDRHAHRGAGGIAGHGHPVAAVAGGRG